MSDQTGTQEPTDKPIDESVDLDRNPKPQNEDQTVSLPTELLAFVNETEWTYAKTMPEWPHEYIVRERVDETLFERLVRYIRTHGYEGRSTRRPLPTMAKGEWCTGRWEHLLKRRRLSIGVGKRTPMSTVSRMGHCHSRKTFAERTKSPLVTSLTRLSCSL